MVGGGVQVIYGSVALRIMPERLSAFTVDIVIRKLIGASIPDSVLSG